MRKPRVGEYILVRRKDIYSGVHKTDIHVVVGYTHFGNIEVRDSERYWNVYHPSECIVIEALNSLKEFLHD